ncbi:MAG TPA: hypothetical protein PLS67_08290 [Accumulibacter sp.]|nr:hypothetical protein [Accumulibacter sp.]
MARKFTVGDEAVFALRDILTGLEAKRYTIAITKIDLDADRVEGNGGDWVFDTLGNELSSPINGPSNSPSQFAPLELQIGKKWTAAWTQQHPTMGKQVAELDLRIATRERLRTDLGEFDTFRIDGSGWLRFQGWGGSTQMRSMERRWWIVPGINYPIRVEAINRASGRAMLTDRIDLVALRQIAVDNAFESVATGGGRSLLLKSR